jgi:hypothetical protein
VVLVCSQSRMLADVVLCYSQGRQLAAAAVGLTVPTAEMCHYSGTAHLQHRQEVRV